VPAAVFVSVNPVGLVPGLYNGFVFIAFIGSPTQTVPVTLEVKNSLPVGVLTLVPRSFAFSYQAGGAIPRR
jgi:hypothetical protein